MNRVIIYYGPIFMSDSAKYQRVMLKLSGEALMGNDDFGHDLNVLERIARETKEVLALGVEICMVVGGGNIFRGATAAKAGMERASADYMGMLATVMNALALQNILEKHDVPTRVLSAIRMDEVAEPFIRRRALRHMEHGRVVICAAGTGNPYFTTDSAAALRAIELKCDVLMKGTKVDGVYDSDPQTNPEAKRFDTLTYKQVLEKDLKVMDGAAIALARENTLPIAVFSITTPGAFAEVIGGNGTFTVIK